MRISYFFHIVVVLSIFAGTIQAKPYIVLFFSRLPLWVYDPASPQAMEDAARAFNERFSDKSAAKINLAALRAQLNQLSHLPISGFFAFYNGYVDCSNNQGMITFPVSGHDTKTLNILLCSGIELRTLTGTTIEATAIPPDKKASAQLYVYKKYTPKDQLAYWKVKKGELPTDNILSPNTVTILTNPNNIYIQEGHFYMMKGPHMALPQNIFITGVHDQLKVMLASLDVGRYFEEMRFQYAMPLDVLLQTLPLNE